MQYINKSKSKMESLEPRKPWHLTSSSMLDCPFARFEEPDPTDPHRRGSTQWFGAVHVSESSASQALAFHASRRFPLPSSGTPVPHTPLFRARQGEALGGEGDGGAEGGRGGSQRTTGGGSGPLRRDHPVRWVEDGDDVAREWRRCRLLRHMKPRSPMWIETPVLAV